MDLGVNVCDLEKFPKETTHISHHVFGHRKLFLVNFRLGIVIVRNDNYQSGMACCSNFSTFNLSEIN